eukprot:scaffold171630_cov34-Attheya_sp.AAC.3
MDHSTNPFGGPGKVEWNLLFLRNMGRTECQPRSMCPSMLLDQFQIWWKESIDSTLILFLQEQLKCLESFRCDIIASGQFGDAIAHRYSNKELDTRRGKIQHYLLLPASIHA